MKAHDYQWLYELEDTFWWFGGMRKITEVLMDPICSTEITNRSTLDAGCGTGANLHWVQRFAGEGMITGIDVTPDALSFCSARGHQHLGQASVTDLPFRDEVFDLVTSFDVLCQLKGSGADEQALAEMYRVLKPGGIAFIRVPAFEWMRSSHDEDLSTYRRYDRDTLAALVKAAGFHPLRMTYANTLLLLPAAFRRLVLKRLGIVEGGSDVKPLGKKLRWLNRILVSALKIEAWWLRKPASTLRAGLSCICVAEKPRD
jgi:ubiquinone/menaquinone biosynthesis C-methylase UbiE